MQDQIQTPDGRALRFKLPHDKGTDAVWFRNTLTPQMLKKAKGKCPILDTWSNLPSGNKQQHLLVVDYDCYGDVSKINSVEDTALDCVARYQNCILFKSVSGNLKLGFLVESNIRPTRTQAAEYLRKQLPTDMHWFDQAGLNRCFVNNLNFDALKSALKLATAEPINFTEPQDPKRKKLNSHAERVADKQLTFVSGPKTYRLYEASEAFLSDELALWARTPHRLHLLKILTACWNLKSNFNLPQDNLAAQIGCSVMQVSIMLKELRNLKVLTITDKTFLQGKKAQTYKAGGVLLYAIQRHQEAHQKKDSNVLVLPVRIQDGHFWKLCLTALSRFQTAENFLSWVDPLEGLTEKRSGEAKRYADHHFRKAA